MSSTFKNTCTQNRDQNWPQILSAKYIGLLIFSYVLELSFSLDYNLTFTNYSTMFVEREAQIRKENHKCIFCTNLFCQSQLFITVYCKMKVQCFPGVTTFHKINMYVKCK